MKTQVKHLYGIKEVENFIIDNGLIPTPFPNMPVEIQFHNGNRIDIREDKAIGMDDECDISERLFVAKTIQI